MISFLAKLQASLTIECDHLLFLRLRISHSIHSSVLNKDLFIAIVEVLENNSICIIPLLPLPLGKYRRSTFAFGHLFLDICNFLIFLSRRWNSVRFQLMISKLYWTAGSARVLMVAIQFLEPSSVFSLSLILL